MALDPNRLRTDIEAAMERQMPPNEKLAPESRQFAADLAAAIARYVADADVTGVATLDREGNTLHQTGTGDLR